VVLANASKIHEQKISMNGLELHEKKNCRNHTTIKENSLITNITQDPLYKLMDGRYAENQL
jgi:hypothetical protein